MVIRLLIANITIEIFVGLHIRLTWDSNHFLSHWLDNIDAFYIFFCYDLVQIVLRAVLECFFLDFVSWNKFCPAWQCAIILVFIFWLNEGFVVTLAVDVGATKLLTEHRWYWILFYNWIRWWTMLVVIVVATDDITMRGLLWWLVDLFCVLAFWATIKSAKSLEAFNNTTRSGSRQHCHRFVAWHAGAILWH